jgi:anti-sigma factor RsiW
MNECIDRDIRDMLPDLLHRTLRSEDRERVEFHLATCETCREELAVLRTVKTAAVFAPAIDVGRIVRQIPPYQRIAPSVEAPARNRVVRWLVAAAMAVLVIGGGSIVLNRSGTPAAVAVDYPSTVPPANSGESVPTPAVVETPPAPAPRNLALAADVASLSDGDLVQLMNEMETFDALPATEAEPVIAVDTVDSL